MTAMAADPNSSLGLGGTCPAGNRSKTGRPERLDDILHIRPPDQHCGQTDLAFNTHIFRNGGSSQICIYRESPEHQCPPATPPG